MVLYTEIDCPGHFKGATMQTMELEGLAVRVLRARSPTYLGSRTILTLHFPTERSHHFIHRSRARGTGVVEAEELHLGTLPVGEQTRMQWIAMQLQSVREATRVDLA